MLAAVTDTSYEIVLLIHIATAFVALAPTFVGPFLHQQGGGDSAVAGVMLRNTQRIYAPALAVTGLLGFGLSGMSDEVYQLSDAWLLIAVVIWIAQNGVLHAMVIPGQRALAAGDGAAASKITQAHAVLAVLWVVLLYLMVFKPGA